jgi:hypothetical protein
MNNAGMDGYSYESTPSHGETKPYGPLTREEMGHGEYATMWADDLSLVVVECYCGWRARSTKRLTAMERLAEHAGTPFSPELASALARVA